MKIEACEREYMIRELQIRNQRLQLELSWKFKRASHFLVFVYDCDYQFDIKTVVQELEKKGISDQDIVSGRFMREINVQDKGILHMNCIREKEFVQNGKTMTISSQILKKGIPYTISIFSCNYEADKAELHVYLPETMEDNQQYVPVIVQPEISYTKKFFDKSTTCILKISRVDEYKDGAIMYHINGCTDDIPLSAESLGRELYIQVPPQKCVEVRIREEYKKYYKKV